MMSIRSNLTWLVNLIQKGRPGLPNLRTIVVRDDRNDNSDVFQDIAVLYPTLLGAEEKDVQLEAAVPFVFNLPKHLLEQIEPGHEYQDEEISEMMSRLWAMT